MTAMLPFLMSALSLRAPKPNLYRKTIWRRFPPDGAQVTPAAIVAVVIRWIIPIADDQSRERESVQEFLIRMYYGGSSLWKKKPSLGRSYPLMSWNV